MVILSRTCPVCASPALTLPGSIAAAFGSNARCEACGSGLTRSKKLRWTAYFALITSTSVVLGVFFSFVLETVAPMLVAALICLGLAVIIPLQADRSDPIASHKIRQEMLKAAGKKARDA